MFLSRTGAEPIREVGHRKAPKTSTSDRGPPAVKPTALERIGGAPSKGGKLAVGVGLAGRLGRSTAVGEKI
eukprot:4767623-Pyramimonas_sp.AAC.1